MIFLIFQVLLPALVHADESCYIPTVQTKGSSPEGERQAFYPGERLTAESGGRRTVTASLGGMRFELPAKDVKKVNRKFCEFRNLCVQIGIGEKISIEPTSDSANEEVPAGIFPVVTQYKSMYRVKAGNGFAWLERDQMKKMKISCGDFVEREVEAPVTDVAKIINESRWIYGFEVGYISDVSSQPLSNLLTPLPGGGVDVNDEAFESPFVEEVSNGTGFYLGATLEMPVMWSLRSKFAVGYKSKSMEYTTRPNPHNAVTPVITYDQLAKVTETETFGLIYVSATLKTSGWKFLKLQWQPGLHLGMDYSLKDFELERRKAPQKTTVYTVASGYDKIEFFYGPRLDIVWSKFNFAVMANFNAYELEPTVALGMQF